MKQRYVVFQLNWSAIFCIMILKGRMLLLIIILSTTRFWIKLVLKTRWAYSTSRKHLSPKSAMHDGVVSKSL